MFKRLCQGRFRERSFKNCGGPPKKLWRKNEISKETLQETERFFASRVTARRGSEQKFALIAVFLRKFSFSLSRFKAIRRASPKRCPSSKSKRSSSKFLFRIDLLEKRMKIWATKSSARGYLTTTHVTIN